MLGQSMVLRQCRLYHRMLPALYGRLPIATSSTQLILVLHSADFFSFAILVSILECLHALPAAAQPLLPQTDPVIAAADCEHVATEAPAYAPGGGVDVQDSGLPFP